MNEKLYGPPPELGQLHHLVPVDVFKNRDLVDLSQFMEKFGRPEAGISRDILIDALSVGGESERYENAITVLNQLSVAEIELNRVKQVVLCVDIATKDTVSPADSTQISEVNGTDWYYNIIFKDDRRLVTNPIDPTLSSSDIQSVGREYATRRRQRMKQREDVHKIDKEQEKIAAIEAERKSVDDIIVDHVALECTEMLRSEVVIRQETDEGTKLYILRSKDNEEFYTEIDLQTGAYIPNPDDESIKFYIKPQHLNFYKAASSTPSFEDNDHEYNPPPLSTGEVKKAYEKAIKLGMLLIYRESDGSVHFRYVISPILYMKDIHFEVDLENAELLLDESYVPLHPDFASYLQQRKEELEKRK